METLEEILEKVEVKKEEGNLNLKAGELLFKKSGLKSSIRLVESDEIVNIIEDSAGITRTSIMLLSGNMLRNDLRNLEKKKVVKAKACAEISYAKPQKIYYIGKKMKISNVKSLELISLGFWYLRNRNLKIGRATIKEDGNVLATAVLDSQQYSLLELISLNQRNYQRKLGAVDNDSITQKVFVVENRELYMQIKSDKRLIDSLVLIVMKHQNDKLINGRSYIEESKVSAITKDYQFAEKLKLNVGNREVERVEESYRKKELLAKKFTYNKN